MLNISKQKWKTCPHWKHKKILTLDMYYIYKCSKLERSKYLNTWYDGVVNDYQLSTFITCKAVDSKSKLHLYCRKYNPVIVRIETNLFESYNVCCKICSVDDSSYTAFICEVNLEAAKQIQLELMEYISNCKVLSGDNLMEHCKQFANNLRFDFN